VNLIELQAKVKAHKGDLDTALACFTNELSVLAHRWVVKQRALAAKCCSSESVAALAAAETNLENAIARNAVVEAALAEMAKKEKKKAKVQSSPDEGLLN